MISIYIHIPFCQVQCDYCNFLVMPQDSSTHQRPSGLLDKYISQIISEINYYHSKIGTQTIKSIYIGGGTPSSIGYDGLTKIIDHICSIWDISYLAELSIEINPNPLDKMIALVDRINHKYQHLPRLRWSIGIQSIDDTVLALSHRGYVWNNITGRLRQLQKVKKNNNIYNFDFIAFGTLDVTDTKTQKKLDFLSRRAHSQMVDSRSIYILELFPGSKWHSLSQKNNNQHISHISHSHSSIDNTILERMIRPIDDAIIADLDIYKSIIYDAGYRRYEVSNYARPGAESIHNLAYRDMSDYIGIGASASGKIPKSMAVALRGKELNDDIISVRYTNTRSISAYISDHYICDSTNICDIYGLTDRDILIEAFMLGLRTGQGIGDIDIYREVLVDDIDIQIENLVTQGYATYTQYTLRLTDSGLDISNHIITNLWK